MYMYELFAKNDMITIFNVGKVQIPSPSHTNKFSSVI